MARNENENAKWNIPCGGRVDAIGMARVVVDVVYATCIDADIVPGSGHSVNAI